MISFAHVQLILYRSNKSALLGIMRLWGRDLTSLRGSLSHSIYRRNPRRAVDDVASTGGRAGFKPRRRERKGFFAKRPGIGQTLAIVIILASLIFLLVSLVHHSRTSRKGIRDPPPVARYLQLLVPVSRVADVDLCKTVLSAQILNYPVPNIIPWGNSSDGTPLPKERRLLDKLLKIRQSLGTLPKSPDGSITILLDGPNTWFQLRPELLLQSYYRIITQANRLLEEKYGSQVIKQKVLFAAQESCTSGNADDVACAASPEPPEPNLARYLGHGAIVGETKAVKAIIERAVERLESSSAPPTKLAQIFAEILGEQELNRNQLPVSHTGLRMWKKRKHYKNHGKALAKQRSDKNSSATLELGIGLDYYNELGILASPTGLNSWQTPVAMLSELEASTPPFWTVSGSEPSIPHSAQWTDVELLTAPGADSVPAMIHHTPTALSGRDSSGLRRQWWPKLWMVKHARALYTAAEGLPKTVVADVVDEMGNKAVFWNSQVHMLSSGAWSVQEKWVHWESMCGAEQVWSEVFRDDAGPWKRTEIFDSYLTAGTTIEV